MWLELSKSPVSLPRMAPLHATVLRELPLYLASRFDLYPTSISMAPPHVATLKGRDQNVYFDIPSPQNSG